MQTFEKLIDLLCLLINKECHKLEKKSLLKKTAVSDLKIPDNLGFLPVSRIAPAKPIIGLSRCFFVWFMEIVGASFFHSLRT